MELSTRFDPKEHEDAIRAAWRASGAFTPPVVTDAAEARRRKTFMVAIPPPNVTGVLHMGHALNNTIQDIVVRHRRMQGYDTLWLPGTDHAGIATQAVVEKKLYAEQGKKRAELGREAFLDEVWKWREEHGDIIFDQLDKMGCSCDWTRTAFTLDPELSRAVREAFCRLFEKGLCYRGARLVNWDCVLQTAVSDDEIEHQTQKGQLWYLRYPIEGPAGEERPGQFIVVATTRPETMLGDTGVAVHPDDERYRSLVGSHAVLPFLERRIPIVADESVQPAFGTGAVKLTPGHDPADYERGARHKLPIINILEVDGRINANGGEFAGLQRDQARQRVVARLDELGLLEKVEDIQHNVALSDRSKSPIEPLVSEQWFVKMEPLAQPALRAVASGRLRFVPERWAKVYQDWLENVQDWCISRQLWWGHRIPVWYDADETPVASREELELGSPHPLTGKPIVRQDPDVLDTWASSWLWPFATLGWPERSVDLERFYPTQFLSTARDIIYLWVARMVMAGYEFLDHLPEDQRCPFSVCNIHATVLDGKGRRMSKSAGNGIDPLELIDKYGADAMRLSLILLTKEGQDVKLSEDKIDQGWRFGNKVWNAARFVMLNLAGERSAGNSAAVREHGALADRWILSRLARTTGEVTAALDEYRLNDAAMTLYRFVWNDFCDWYLELAKGRLGAGDGASGAAARGTLARVLGDTLALLHPFTPFITEVLWKALCETLGERAERLLIQAAWPAGEGLAVDLEAEAEMATLQGAIAGVRRVRALTMIGEKKAVRAIFSSGEAAERAVLEAHGAALSNVGFLESFEVREGGERPAGTAVAVDGSLETIVFLDADADLAKLCDALATRRSKLEKGVAQLDGKLGNAQFVERADPEVVEAERQRRAEMVLELELVSRNLAGLR